MSGAEAKGRGKTDGGAMAGWKRGEGGAKEATEKEREGVTRGFACPSSPHSLPQGIPPFPSCSFSRS